MHVIIDMIDKTVRHTCLTITIEFYNRLKNFGRTLFFSISYNWWIRIMYVRIRKYSIVIHLTCCVLLRFYLAYISRNNKLLKCKKRKSIVPRVSSIPHSRIYLWYTFSKAAEHCHILRRLRVLEISTDSVQSMFNKYSLQMASSKLSPFRDWIGIWIQDWNQSNKKWNTFASLIWSLSCYGRKFGTKKVSNE